MTTKELLEKAKAVGGWQVKDDLIRNRANDCPLMAVFGKEGYIVAGLEAGLPSWKIMATADGWYGSLSFDGELRKEMESWCK